MSLVAAEGVDEVVAGVQEDSKLTLEEQPRVLTVQEMDLLVEDCFFSAIKDKSNKIGLPILSSALTKMLFRYWLVQLWFR